MGHILFITGTSTGVGKTLLTGALLDLGRHAHHDVLAMKPFCTGSRHDVDQLQRLQPGMLGAAECNPFFAPDPLAPAVAMGQRGPGLEQVTASIRRLARRCELLLVEGAGGLLAPLGSDYDARDLIRALHCHVCVAARNELGTINHTRLTLEALRPARPRSLGVVLMEGRKPDPSAATNRAVLERWCGGVPVGFLPFLGPKPLARAALERNRKKIKKVLVPVLPLGILSALPKGSGSAIRPGT